MGLFNRFKNMFSPSASSDDKGHKHQRHEAADFTEEQAEVDQITRSGIGRPMVNDHTAAAEIQTYTNREDDGSKEMLIERERRDAEHGE